MVRLRFRCRCWSGAGPIRAPSFLAVWSPSGLAFQGGGRQRTTSPHERGQCQGPQAQPGSDGKARGMACLPSQPSAAQAAQQRYGGIGALQQGEIKARLPWMGHALTQA